MIQIIGNILLFIAFLPFLLYSVLFATRSPNWHKSEMGVHLMIFNATLAAVLGLSVIRLAAGASLDVLWFQILRLIVFIGVPIVGFKQLQLLIKAQHEERNMLEGRINDVLAQEEEKQESILEMPLPDSEQRQT